MKSKILLLVAAFLLVGVNLYAAGDLQVNGKLGVGGTFSSLHKMSLRSTDIRGASIKATLNQDGILPSDIVAGLNVQASLSGTASGYVVGNSLTAGINSTASNVYAGVGGGFGVSFSNDIAGTTNVDFTAAGKFATQLNPGDRDYIVADGYGFILSLTDFRFSGTGSLYFNDYKNISINNAANDYGALSVDNLSGIWIDQLTAGTVNNYGIVLDGDGAGSDVSFGYFSDGIYSGRPRLYSNGGRLYAQDSSGFNTILSPHDPETGEWIFYSKNTNNGKVVRVNMEKLVKAVEKLTGENFMIETIEK